MNTIIAVRTCPTIRSQYLKFTLDQLDREGAAELPVTHKFVIVDGASLDRQDVPAGWTVVYIPDGPSGTRRSLWWALRFLREQMVRLGVDRAVISEDDFVCSPRTVSRILEVEVPDDCAFFSAYDFREFAKDSKPPGIYRSPVYGADNRGWWGGQLAMFPLRSIDWALTRNHDEWEDLRVESPNAADKLVSWIFRKSPWPYRLQAAPCWIEHIGDESAIGNPPGRRSLWSEVTQEDIDRAWLRFNRAYRRSRKVVVMALIPGEIPRGAVRRRDVGYARYGVAAWSDWCVRHGIELLVWDKPVPDHDGRLAGLSPTLQRWTLPRVVVDERGPDTEIIMIDADTMIRPDAPDPFELFPHLQFASVVAGIGPFLTRAIPAWSPLFGGITVPRERIFYTGFNIIRSYDLPIMDGFGAFLRENRDRILEIVSLGPDVGTDQPLLNLYLHSKGYQASYIPIVWNDVNVILNQKGLDRRVLGSSYVWHFSHVYVGREKLMAEAWSYLKGVGPVLVPDAKTASRVPGTIDAVYAGQRR